VTSFIEILSLSTELEQHAD